MVGEIAFFIYQRGFKKVYEEIRYLFGWEIIVIFNLNWHNLFFLIKISKVSLYKINLFKKKTKIIRLGNEEYTKMKNGLFLLGFWNKPPKKNQNDSKLIAFYKYIQKIIHLYSVFF